MENKNLIYWSVGALLVLAVIMLFIGGERNINDNNSDIAVTTVSESMLELVKNDFDFGSISMKDGEVSTKFEIVNNGVEAVKIGRVYTSCACTTAYMINDSGEKIGKFGMPGHKGLRTNADVEVPAGGKVIVEVIYDPAFHGPSGVGLAERSVYVETNSLNAPKLELKFRATVSR